MAERYRLVLCGSAYEMLLAPEFESRTPSRKLQSALAEVFWEIEPLQLIISGTRTVERGSRKLKVATVTVSAALRSLHDEIVKRIDEHCYLYKHNAPVGDRYRPYILPMAGEKKLPIDTVLVADRVEFDVVGSSLVRFEPLVTWKLENKIRASS